MVVAGDSTAAVVMVAAAFTVVGSAAATVVEVTATAAGEWARDTVVADMEACAADTRGAALEVEEVGRPVEVLPADGRVGAETIEVTLRAPSPTGSGIPLEPRAAGSWRRESVVSADRLIGAEAITAGAAALVGEAGTVVGEGVGAVAGDLALASAGGRDGILFGIGRRTAIARGGTMGIRLTFIQMCIRRA